MKISKILKSFCIGSLMFYGRDLINNDVPSPAALLGHTNFLFDANDYLSGPMDVKNTLLFSTYLPTYVPEALYSDLSVNDSSDNTEEDAYEFTKYINQMKEKVTDLSKSSLAQIAQQSYQVFRFVDRASFLHRKLGLNG